MEKALEAVKTRSEEAVKRLCSQLKGPLIDVPTSHAAVFSYENAKRCDLPVTRPDLDSREWKVLWSLWAYYYAIGSFQVGNTAVYEGKGVSHIESPTGIVN